MAGRRRRVTQAGAGGARPGGQLGPAGAARSRRGVTPARTAGRGHGLGGHALAQAARKLLERLLLLADLLGVCGRRGLGRCVCVCWSA